ncbi:hypothetical protein HYV82_00050, partial [Candidatus Woesearchaeota archaeon]|nr:hypothetical protein [Candidatus Woesearchaeota archaeon]
MMKTKPLTALVAVFAIVLMAVIANAFPIMNPIGAKSVNEGSALTFNISINESFPGSPGSGTNFSNFSSATMKGAQLKKFNNTLATFTWTPPFDTSGSYTVNFTAANGTASAADPITASVGEPITITVNDVPASMTASGLTLGGKSQARSNPRSDDEVDENILITGSMTVTNNGIEPITGLNVTSITPSGFSSSAINMTVTSISATSINASETSTITFQARIPEDLDAVDSNTLEEKTFTVATITVKGTPATGGTITKTASATMQAENNLRIKDVKVTVDDDSEDVDDGDTVENVRPGAKATVEIKIENRFGKDDDVDLQDVEVRVINDDLDLDEDETAGDISPKKTKTVIIKFDVDEDADEDDYEIEIEAEADDENGAKHGDKLKFRLEVEREEHEITIQTAEMSPESAACEATSDLRVSVKNTGQNDEDDVFIRVASPDLQFGTVIGPFDLDEDDSKSYTIQIPVPANISAGIKRVGVETYFEGDELSDKDVALLRKGSCSGETTTPPPKTDKPVEVVTPPPPPVVAQPPAETRK